MPVIIREYGDLKRGRVGDVTPLAHGVLVTDELGEAIKVVTPTNAPADAPALTARTNFVVMENTGVATVRYAIRPKGRATPLPATASHPFVPVGGTVVEAVYPSAIISMIEA